MEHHDCQPPMERRPIEDRAWTCPDCGDLWTVRPLGSVDSAQSYDFATGEHITNAEWVRLRSREASPRVLIATFGEPEGTELRCSFCWKSRRAVSKLISGPGTGPNRVLICDECVELCVEIIVEEQAETEAEQEEVRGGEPPTTPPAGAK